MSTFPGQLGNKITKMVSDTAKAVTSAHQRLNTIGSQVSALQPGDWAAIELAAGWTDLAGYIPAQVRYQGAGLAYVVGHITGGTTVNGTVIGSVAEGYYNQVHLHTFTATVMGGASAVAVAGTVAGTADNSGLTDGTITASSASGGLTDGTMNGNSGAAISGTTVANHIHGGGSYAVTNGQHTHGAGSYSVTNGHHTHGATGLTPSVPVNYNTVTLTMNTTGQLILTNCSPAVTQLSFNEPLPLVTS